MVAKGDEALLVEVLIHLGSAELIEQILVDERKKYRETLDVHGATEGKRIYVNPLQHKKRDEVVCTLLHEGVHRARPCWKERSVTSAEHRLFKRMSQEQADAVFLYYRRAVRRLKGVREI